MTSTNFPLEGIYFHNVNEDIKLVEDNVIIDPKGAKILGSANISLKILPNPKTIINIYPTAFLKMFEPSRKVTVEFKKSKLTLEVRVTGFEVGKEIKVKAITPYEIFIGDPKDKVEKIILHLFNFPKLSGVDGVYVEKNQKRYLKGLTNVQAEGWNIIINEVKNLKDKIDTLRSTGGYSISHILEISKTNSKSFTYINAKDLIRSLSRYFSFCRGYFTVPILSVGLDRNDKKVFERWIKEPIDSWRDNLSWFDSEHGNLLREVFPGYLKLWKDKLWSDPITHAIYWYVLSNSMTAIEPPIILAQTALELLSWTYIVKDKKYLSKDGYKKVSASDRISLLCSYLNIPIEIDEELKDLTKLAKCFNWNGPKAITEIRNFIVHPEKEGTPISKQKLPLQDVWRLSLWYLELVLLHLFKHNGVYSNRLTSNKFVGQVENVPWAK